MDVWECDLIDVQALSRHNDGVRYLLTVIDVFSKFLHMVPLNSKSGKDVSAAFRSVLMDPDIRSLSRDAPSGFESTRGKNSSTSRFKSC